MRPEALAGFAGDRAARRRHAAALLLLARRLRVDGLDLNYENLAVTADLAAARGARAGYTALVRDVCRTLRADRRRCIVTVMPRTSERPHVWRGRLMPWVYGYAALGRAADRVRVMAYDQHGPETDPGPIGGLRWTRRVVRFAARKVPRRKLELGIPLYGRDWGGDRPRPLRWGEAEALRRRVGAARRWDAASASPFFEYEEEGRPHVVWFSDAASTTARLALARRERLAGVALWALENEDPAVWDAIRAASRRHSAPGG